MRVRYYTQKAANWITDLPVGGAWGRTLEGRAQKNLRYLWFDGLFASGSDNIIINFMSLYVLALGGTQVQVGLMSSLSSFTGAFMLLIGAALAGRFANHKNISVYSGGLFGRLCILLLVFVPILFKGMTAVWIAILLSVLRDAAGNMGYPSWMSVINETVPLEGRGRYFGSRNFVMGLAGMFTTLLAGKVITLFAHQTGYQIAIAAAFVLGVGSTYSFSKIRYQPRLQAPVSGNKSSWRDLMALLKKQPQFIALILTASIWNFAINVSGPFFNVHMAQTLKFSASVIGLMSVVTAMSGMLVLNRLGNFSDRFGPRKVQLVSMCLIPTLPVMWIFAKTPLHIALINIYGGVIWAAFNLASFNLMLNSIPANQVPRFSAVYQIMVTLSLAFGALFGSAIITRTNFNGVLIASTFIRIIAAVLFAWLVREPQKTAPEEI